MAKMTYRITAFVWNKRSRAYEPQIICEVRDYFDAVSAYDGMKVNKDMPVVELYEAPLRKHGLAGTYEIIRQKDQYGESEL